MNPPSTPKILFVDDDPNVLAAFGRTLRGKFAFETASGGSEALHRIKADGPYAIVVADMRMPLMDGLELLERVRTLAPGTVRMMLTGNADQQTVVGAVNRGQVYAFLNKPCPPEELVPALARALNHYEVLRTEQDVLEKTLTGTIQVLSEVLGMVAPAALGRGQRLRDCMRKFAGDIEAGPLWELELGALLSPIGYASLPPSLLHKLKSDLSEQERSIERRVPQIGYELVARIPRLGNVAEIIRYQMKRYDGSGFPQDDRQGAEIPIGARMLKILSDRLDLESDGIAKGRAEESMAGSAGSYDPDLLRKCFFSFPEFLDTSIAADRPVRSLRVEGLKAGQVVISDICTRTGVVLVAASNKLTEMVIERLRNYGELNDVREPILVQDPAGGPA